MFFFTCDQKATSRLLIMQLLNSGIHSMNGLEHQYYKFIAADDTASCQDSLKFVGTRVKRSKYGVRVPCTTTQHNEPSQH